MMIGIDYSNLDYGTSLHFATVGSNNGHDGLSGRVFLNNSEVIKDFAYRAVHVEAVVGKQIVEAYYKRPHDKSYFLGCSTGGRQGTQSALKYPADFDGIVAGAPATDWNTYLGWDAMLGRYVGVPHANKSASYIPPDLWNTIATEILNQCDAIDGAEDGIITEPDACEFRPETLLCNDDNTAACITRAQLGALKRIYQPLYGTNGELVYPRYDPGTEADGNAQEILSGTSTGFSYDWYRFAIFNNTAYDFSQFNSYDIALAQSINPGGISTFSGDLSHFNRRGGKLISYHGRRDQTGSRKASLLTLLSERQLTDMKGFIVDIHNEAFGMERHMDAKQRILTWVEIYVQPELLTAQNCRDHVIVIPPISIRFGKSASQDQPPLRSTPEHTLGYLNAYTAW
ncbi:hypothetical protein H0H92_012037 [Tricholoma furcatifolium]|nr:hypothetical protein H0H92_012037 [Tricholoma furcatifolium]